MFCTSCGKELRLGSKFCTACGAPVVQGAFRAQTVEMQTGTTVSPAQSQWKAGGAAGLTSLNIKLIAIIAAAVILSIGGIWFTAGWYGGLSGTYRYYGSDFVFDTITFSRTGKVEATGGLFAGTGVVGRYTRTKDGYFVNFRTTSDGSFGAGRATLMVTDFFVSNKGDDIVTVQILTSSSLSGNWYFVKRDFYRY